MPDLPWEVVPSRVFRSIGFYDETTSWLPQLSSQPHLKPAYQAECQRGFDFGVHSPRSLPTPFSVTSPMQLSDANCRKH
jgi:hypothetical protein